MTRTRSHAAMPALAVPGYLLLERCWEDATTVTFAAEEASGGSAFVKVLKSHLSDGADRDALRRDYEIASKTDVEGVIRPLTWGTTDLCDFIVLPDDGTRPLQEMLLLEGQIDLVTAMELLAALARTLAALHNNNIVHANITASSVWFSKTPQQIRLADFSRAVRRSDPLAHEPRLPIDLHYVAPEQTGRIGGGVDARSDLYALGALAYHLLCGSPLFHGSSPVELIHAHLARLPTPPTAMNGQIPQVVSDLVLKLLSKAPEDRYQTAEALEFDLRQCVAELRSGGAIGDIRLATRDASAGFRIPDRLYGREAERAILCAALERTARGAREAVIISGHPGVGKSLLVKSIEADALARGAFVAGKFDQYKESEPYSVIIGGLRDVIDRVLAGDARSVGIWRRRLVEALGVNGAVIADVVPEIELIIGSQPPVQELPPTEKRNRFNRVFRRFVRALARPDHPLFMVLDDLQWSDTASLALLKTLLTDPGISHFLVIGTYRDDELRDSSELERTLRDLRASGLTLNEIHLTPLVLDQVAELLSDTLHCPAADTLELATHVLRKTDGNPFFIYQLLSFLHRSRLINFDFDKQCWSWDLDAIAAQGVTENVLQLMTRKLTVLPPLAQEALKVAACLGLRFSLHDLSLVLDYEPDLLADALNAAEREGLVVRLATGDANQQPEGMFEAERHVGTEFQFLHDRVQQAAYAMIAAGERQRLRLGIGRKLLDGVPIGQRNAIPFVILDNLNDGIELLRDPAERHRVAELNLAAGRRARERAAFDAALNYFRSGMRLLNPDCWESHYQLTLALHFERFECAYVMGYGEEANELFREVIAHAREPVETAQAYYLKILLSSGLDRSEEAVALGIEALRLFGERLPSAPTMLDLLRELARVIYRLKGRKADALLDLPRMSDPQKQAVISLLMAICPAAYFRNPDLMSLSALKIVSMSLGHGQTSASPFGYVLYGLIRGALFNDYKGGHEFGRLAVELADRDGLISQRCKIRMIFGGFINYWRQPIETSLELLRSSLQLALDCGDVQYANYSILQILFLRLARGDDLGEMEQECQRYEHSIEQTSDWFAVSSYRVRRQYVLALKNRTSNGWSLTDSGYDEQSAVAAFETAGNLTAWSYYLIVKMQLTFLFGQLDEARRFAQASEAQIRAVLNQIVVAEHYFYSGLTSVALLRRAKGRGRDLWRALNRARAKLRRWARHCPENFSPHHLLVEAEFMSLKGRPYAAERGYEAALAAAQQHGFRHVEALANELAGEFYLASERRNVAKAYLHEARKAYARWGATAKVEQITQKHRAFFRDEDSDRPATKVISTSEAKPLRELLEVDIILRASSGTRDGVDAHRLLNRVGELMLESTGGSNALFIVQHENGLSVETAVAAEAAGARMGAAFSERVVMYVLRTGNRLVLNEPLSDARFASCPHIQSQRPRSIICVPLLKKGEVLGVAYIENSSIAASFAPDNLNALTLLTHQAAVVIDNERLDRNLRDNASSLQSALANLELLQHVREQLTKFVPQSLQKRIESNPQEPDFDNRMEDLSILFLDMAGYTLMSEHLSADELNTVVETYFSSFLDDIRRNGGEINGVAGDGLMIVFQAGDRSEHARRAVSTALAIKRKAAEINTAEHPGWPAVVINMGINSGEALIGASKMQGATAMLFVYTVTGYVANLAARVGAFARDGAILVSEETALRLGREFNLESMGPQAFKNISRPIEVFRVVDEAPERGPPVPVSERLRS